MLYECWSGENPNRRATPAATARAIGDRHRPLRRLRPDLPRELAATVDACLEPRPGRRPSLEELGTAIEGSLDLLAEQRAHRAHAIARCAAARRRRRSPPSSAPGSPPVTALLLP